MPNISCMYYNKIIKKYERRIGTNVGIVINAKMKGEAVAMFVPPLRKAVVLQVLLLTFKN